jgi:large repetitive protein
MRVSLVTVLMLVLAVPATAATIRSIDPSTIQERSGEYVLTIFGSELGGVVIFDGPAGRFAVEPQTADSTAMRAWIPLEVVNTPGTYEVIVSGTQGDSNAARLVVHPVDHPFVILGQDPITAEAASRDGAVVTFEVFTFGGKDPNPVEVRCTPKPGSLFPLGPNRVHCEATNRVGEHAEGGVYIFVYDGKVPVLRLPQRIVVDADGPDGKVVEYTASASDAIDGEVPVECNPKSGSRFPVGVTKVNCVATDSSLNPAHGSFEVEVRGQQTGTLVIHVPADITVEANGPSGTEVRFQVSASGTGDPNPMISCSPASESTFPIGRTRVSCIATDRFGNRADGEFNVTVRDTTPPELPLFDITVETTGSSAVVNFDVVATDKVDGTVPVTCDPKSGSTFPAGVTTVNCSATDSSLNSTQGSFRVEVKRTATGTLVIHVPADITAEATSASGSEVRFQATASGTDDPEPAISCSPASESTFPIGRTRVSCIATDRFGNRADGEFNVTVADTRPPALTVFDITAEAKNGGAADVEFEVAASDTVDGPVTVTCDPKSGARFAIGTTTVRCTATDAHGNIGQASFVVRVVDLVAPQIASVSATPNALHPPNSKLADVALSVDVSDNNDPAPQCQAVSVTSNDVIEGPASPNYDWRLTGPLTLELRAERSGGDERVYTIHVSCVDDGGNESMAATTVTVPKGTGNDPASAPATPSKRRGVGKK